MKAENIGEFFSNGASAAAFGGSIFDLKKLESGVVDGIKADIEALISNLGIVKKKAVQGTLIKNQGY